MSTTLQATVKSGVYGTLNSGALAGTGIYTFVAEPDIVFVNGVAANKADTIFSDVRTLAASGSETLLLTASLKDQFGNVITFAKVKALLIKASAANTNNVVVGNAATHAFQGPLDAATDTLTIPPGGSVLLLAPVNGWVVTASTNDNIKITNSAGTTGVTYDIVIIGTST